MSDLFDEGDEVRLSAGKGFNYNSYKLHESDRMRIEAQVISIPDKKTGKVHHFDLVIKKLRKNPSQDWSDSEVSKINFTSDQPESLQRLIKYLKAQPELSKLWGNNVSVKIDNNADKDEAEFVKKVLFSFDTPEKRKLLIKAKSEDVNNLHASIKYARNIQAVKEFKGLIDDNSTPEHSYQKWLKANPWVFGSEYLKFSDLRKIGISSESDFIAISLDSFADLIEIKKSSFKLFVYDSDHKCYYPHSDLTKAIGQAIHYLNVIENYRDRLKEDFELDVLKPRIKIVIGRSSLLKDKEKKSLRLLNDSLHNIEVITYDEILSRASSLTENLT